MMKKPGEEAGGEGQEEGTEEGQAEYGRAGFWVCGRCQVVREGMRGQEKRLCTSSEIENKCAYRQMLKARRNGKSRELSRWKARIEEGYFDDGYLEFDLKTG